MTSENLAYLTYCVGEQNTMGFDSKQVNAIQKQSRKIPPNRMTQSMAPGLNQGNNDRVTASAFMRDLEGDEQEESYASDSDDDSEDDSNIEEPKIVGNQSEIVQANKYQEEEEEEGNGDGENKKKKKKWGFNMKMKMPKMKGLGFGKKKKKGEEAEEGEAAPKKGKKGPK